MGFSLQGVLYNSLPKTSCLFFMLVCLLMRTFKELNSIYIERDFIAV